MVQFAIKVALSIFIGTAILCADSLASDESTILQSFGSGSVKVRLYTDYFCGPCLSVEPELEPLIRKLVRDNKINLTFIDTPIHKHSPLYARYFLFAANGINELEAILRIRSVLFDAAKENVTDATALEAYVKQRGVGLRPSNVSSTLTIRNRYLKSDNINSTPSCVIEWQDRKELHKGARDIVSALKRLS